MIRSPLALLVAVVSAPLAPTGARAQERPAGLPPAPSYEARRVSGGIVLDGALDEVAWRSADAIPLSWEITPGDNTPAPVETVCRIVYDDVAVYFGCDARDPDPAQIRAHLAERDDRVRTIQDDHVVFLLDTFNDERRGFEFRVNAAGVQMDAILARAEGIEDFSWDAVWYSEVRRTSTGWTLEVAIPFGSLRFPRSDGPQTWGVVIDRSYPRSVRTRMRSAPTDRNTTCLLCGANKITGFEGIEPGGSVELVPTLTALRTDTRDPFPTGDLQSSVDNGFGNVDPDVGLDVRWGITTSLSLNGMVNPDFSQVEADVAQLAENRRFALLFPETRPFFLEGADFFATPVQAVFTRSVVDPDGGIKLTGKEGPNAIGVFAARDASTGLLFPSNQGSAPGFLDQGATNAVLRYRRDIGQTSSLGVLYTGRGGDDYRNDVYGVDAFHRITPSNSVRVQYLRSGTEYPGEVATAFEQPEGRFGGGAFWGEFQHFSRDWVATARYQDLTPEFRADAGFVPRVDVRIVDGSLGRIFYGTDSWFTRFQTAATFSRTTDQTGLLTDRSVGATLTYQGPRQSTVEVSPSRRTLLFGGVEHDLNRVEGSAEIRPSGSVTLASGVRVGDFVDFANNRKSFGLVLTPSASLYVGPRLALTLAHTHQRLRHDGNAVYTADLSQARVLYHFNVRSFVRAVVQYRNIERDPDQYVNPVGARVDRLLTQLLFSYQVNPQTALYAGYTDGHEGTQDFDLTQRTRTFFLKVGYAIHP